MNAICRFAAVCTLAGVLVVDAHASPGDVFVPAHRTRDGHYVPPNVPPISGGTYPARRPSRASAAHRSAHVKAKLLPPILVEAQPVLR